MKKNSEERAKKVARVLKARLISQMSYGKSKKKTTPEKEGRAIGKTEGKTT